MTQVRLKNDDSGNKQISEFQFVPIDIYRLDNEGML